MRVTIGVHTQAAPGLAEWVHSAPGRPDDRRALLRVYLADIMSRLEQFAGHPPGAERRPGFEPPLFEWNYAEGLWVRYAVRDVRRWFRVRERKITILRFAPRPLDPAAS
jgi:hypothetical protein